VLDEKLLSILVCPQDRGPLLYTDNVLYNPRLRRVYRIEDGIPVLLVDEALDASDEQHAQFTRAGQRLRQEDPLNATPEDLR
jgi:uncharacterized protein YbaR (Trm112 family)